MAKKFLCRIADIPENGLKEVTAEDGEKLLIASSAGDLFGYQASCPHQEVALCEGLYDGSVLTCHMHLWQWDIRTGEPMGIAEAPLRKYALAVEGDSVFVAAEASALDVGELFRGISAPTSEKLMALARSEKHEAGAVLYGPGDAAEDFFILDSGRVEFVLGRLERTAPGGFMLNKGEVFGWAALLEEYPRRIASARCLEPSVLLRINGKAALAVLEQDPASGYLVMRRLAALIARHLAAR
jgi:toluene monooxygenase system ferredoxin subunit